MAGQDGIDLNSSSPEDLHAMFEKLEAGESLEPGTQEQPPEQTPAEQPKPQDQPQPQQQQEQEPSANLEDQAAGVATKDGKHVIPYSVLKNERERANRADQLAREMQERVAALEAQIKSGGSQGANNGESARTEQPVSDVSDEDLEALKEDFPTVYKAVTAAMAHAKALEAKLQPVEEAVHTQQQEQFRSQADTVQEAIDSVPKLAHIQAADPAAFELAKQFDAVLKDQAAWQGKSLSERFAKVVQMVEAANGEISLPGQQQAPASQQKPADLSKAAQEKAAQAAKQNRSNVPISLSEFPAGQHAAQDEREAAEQLTHQQLAEKFSGMSPEQMDAYFQTL